MKKIKKFSEIMYVALSHYSYYSFYYNYHIKLESCHFIIMIMIMYLYQLIFNKITETNTAVWVAFLLLTVVICFGLLKGLFPDSSIISRYICPHKKLKSKILAYSDFALASRAQSCELQMPHWLLVCSKYILSNLIYYSYNWYYCQNKQVLATLLQDFCFLSLCH